MARFAYQPRPAGLPVSPAAFKRWVPSLAVWGVGAGAAVAYLMSDVPVFQKDVLLKIPVLKQHFIDNTPASDKPF